MSFSEEDERDQTGADCLNDIKIFEKNLEKKRGKNKLILDSDMPWATAKNEKKIENIFKNSENLKNNSTFEPWSSDSENSEIGKNEKNKVLEDDKELSNPSPLPLDPSKKKEKINLKNSEKIRKLENQLLAAEEALKNFIDLEKNSEFSDEIWKKKSIELIKKNRKMQVEILSMRHHLEKAIRERSDAERLLAEKNSQNENLKSENSGPFAPELGEKNLEKKLLFFQNLGGDLRRKNEELKNKIRKRNKIIERETGEEATDQVVERLFHEDSSWKGRAEIIEKLQRALGRAKKKLEKIEKNEKIEKKEGEEMRNEEFQDDSSVYPGSTFSLFAEKRRVEFEKIKSENVEIKKENEEIKVKQKGMKARQISLESELKKLKEKLKIFLEKSEGDDEVINLLKIEISKLKSQKEGSTFVENQEKDAKGPIPFSLLSELKTLREQNERQTLIIQALQKRREGEEEEGEEN